MTYTFVPTTANSGESFYYDVSAENAIGNSDDVLSNSVAYKLPAVPATPTGLTVFGSGGVCVSWNAAPGVGTYNVYYSTVAGNAKAGSGTLFTSTSATTGVPNLDPKQVYYFSVSAENASGRSAQSAEVASKIGQASCFG